MGRSVEAGRAVLKLLLDDKELNKKFASLKRRVRNVGRGVKSAGLAIGGLGSAITAPFALAIASAAEAQEVYSKFDTVFGKNRASVKAWGDEFASQVGRSKVETAKFLASFQDLLVPVGFEPGAAENTSKQLVALATDLASFNNMQDADVIRDLQAALTGSGEVMKKYGVIVSEAAVKQELLNMNMDPKHATEVEKAQARLNLIMAGTTAAQGDALRTAGSFTNQMKSLKAKVADASVEVGTIFIPAVTRAVGVLATAVKYVAEFIAGNKRLVLVVGVVGAALLAAGTALVTMGAAISAATIGVSGLLVAFTFLTAHPLVAALVAIGLAASAIAGYFYLAGDAAEEAGEKIAAVGGGKRSGNPAINGAKLKAQQKQIAAEAASVQRQLEEKLSASPAIGQSAPAKPTDVDKRMLKVLIDQTHILADTLTELRNGGGLVAGAY